jgi:hypothetical protein
MKEVKKLIDLGKEKGYLTYDDVNDMLPAEVVSPDQIDDVMSIFGEMDIEVVDSNQRVTLGGAGEDLADDEEDDEEREDTDDELIGVRDQRVGTLLRRREERSCRFHGCSLSSGDSSGRQIAWKMNGATRPIRARASVRTKPRSMF